MTSSPAHVGVVAGDDAFAGAVTGSLIAGLAAAGRMVTTHGLGPDLDPERLLMGSEVTVVVLDRYDRAVVERFDVAAHGTRRPWLAITVRHPYVQVGPYVSPFRGACHRCLEMRLTHRGRLDRTAQLSGSTPGGWTRGIAPHTAATTAAVALGTLLDGAPTDRRDAMVLVHSDGLEVSRTPVVGAHLCPRCGDRLGHRPPARDNDRIRAVLPTARGPR